MKDTYQLNSIKEGLKDLTFYAKSQKPSHLFSKKEKLASKLVVLCHFSIFLDFNWFSF